MPPSATGHLDRERGSLQIPRCSAPLVSSRNHAVQLNHGFISSLFLHASEFPDLCAQALSALTCANEEFARQAIIAPTPITLALEVLYLGGGGDGEEGANSNVRGKSIRKVAARCRLSGAISLVAIFEGVEASQNTR